MLSAIDQADLKSELRSGERLLWSGKPMSPPRGFGHYYMLIFPVFWLLVLVVLFLPAGLATLASGEAFIFGVFFLGIVFIFLGIGFFMLRMGVRGFVAPAKELYAVTNHRGIVLSRYGKKICSSISPNDLLSSERKMKNETVGTLSFGPGIASMFEMQASFFGSKIQPAFKNVSDPKSVEILISKTFGRYSNEGATS